jgi:hypothetical protein
MLRLRFPSLPTPRLPLGLSPIREEVTLLMLFPPNTRAFHRDIDSVPIITIDQFRALTKRRGWSEDWLVEQCRDEMDNSRPIIREILHGRGLTNPRFTSESTKSKPVNMAATILVWTPLIDLFLAYDGLCVECDGVLSNVDASYCSPRCRKRASRRNPKRHADPQISATVPA